MCVGGRKIEQADFRYQSFLRETIVALSCRGKVLEVSCSSQEGGTGEGVAELPVSAFPACRCRGGQGRKRLNETFKMQPQYFSVCPSSDQEDLGSVAHAALHLDLSITFVLMGGGHNRLRGARMTATSSLRLLGTTKE